MAGISGRAHLSASVAAGGRPRVIRAGDAFRRNGYAQDPPRGRFSGGAATVACRSMAEHPRHPDSDGSADAPRERPRSAGVTVALMIAGVLVLLAVIALHLVGALGPGAHG